MTPEQNALFVEMAAILRRPGPLQKLMQAITEHLIKIVPLDAVRYDLTDTKGGIWSRVCKPGQEPDRPGLGVVLRIKTKEELVREDETVSVPLGFGDRASGRIFCKKSGGFSDEEVEALQRMADLFTLALRNRPFDPRPKPRSPFDEPKEFL